LGEIVEITFSVNNEPFRVRGQARADLEGAAAVGFQFITVSERTGRRLLGLAEELLEASRKIEALRKAYPHEE
jgi:hypothetical protein